MMDSSPIVTPARRLARRLTLDGGTAHYVQGSVGLARGALKKVRVLKHLSHRHGVIVISLFDGGSLSFYKKCQLDVPDEDRVPGLSVYATQQRFRPSNEPYLHIPGNVPWEFKALGDHSFQILVPPIKGKVDYRVKLSKYRYNLQKKLSNVDDDSYGSSESNDDIDYSKKKILVFAFMCQHSDEIAVYSTAAQNLNRHSSERTLSRYPNLMPTSNTLSRYTTVMPTSNTRVRTAAGLEIAAQSALIGRTSSVMNVKSRRPSSLGEAEFRCFPLYCYPNTWMTKRGLAVELPRASKNVHDLRVGAPEGIGSLKIEVLQCSGLPKLDRIGLTDAYCYIVCGSTAFVTDVIPDNCNPCWLPASRRACILPINNAYSQVYVGVFDYDGEKSEDDFAGRVVIDIPQLQPGSVMDVTLPLRECSRIYTRRSRGSIRLRLQLDWTKGTRAALLSYLPRNLSGITRRMESPNNTVTVACPDAKSFHNVVRTVYGKDFPGRGSSTIKKAATLEAKLIKTMLIYHTQKTLMDIISWKTPMLSGYCFYGWMYFVMRGPEDVPTFIVSFLFIFMVNNYIKYHVNSASAQLYGHMTISDMTQMLLSDNVVSKAQMPNPDRKIMNAASDIWNAPGNHAEFPFSTLPKISSGEAAASPIWEAAQDGTIHNDGDIFSDASHESSAEDSDDESDHDYLSEDECSSNGGTDDDYLNTNFGRSTINKAKLRIGPSIPLVQSISLVPKKQKQKSNVDTIIEDTIKVDVPDQNVDNKRRKGRSMQQEVDKMHSNFQKASLSLFDDRVFLADRVDAEKVLRINVTKNPIKRKLFPLMAQGIKTFDIPLSAFRAVFNILFWKDPMLSYWVTTVVFFVMMLLLVFPWRKFFFVVGLFGLGPQNAFLVDWYCSKKATEKYQQSDGNGQETGGIRSIRKTLHDVSNIAYPRKSKDDGQSMPLSKSPLLLRDNIQMKPDGLHRDVIVPSVPFRYNRFYDWPPDPALSTIKYINKNGPRRSSAEYS